MIDKNYRLPVNWKELKRAREKMELSRTAVDSLSGHRINHHTLTGWEAGRHYPPYELLEVLALLYEVPIEQFLAKDQGVSQVQGKVEKWLETIYDGDPDHGGKPVKQDELLLTRIGDEEIEAEIKRIKPATMEGRRYRFRGLHVKDPLADTIVGYYRRSGDRGSIGTIILHEVRDSLHEIESKFFRGYYSKLYIAYSNISQRPVKHAKIVLDWNFLEYVE